MKTIIVTGANSGLGLWTSKLLLDLNFRVIMACRDVDKTINAVNNFEGFDKTKAFEIKKIDLADFDSIKKFVEDLLPQESIYGISCNAGISYEGEFSYTKNGIEETFGVNHLGHFLLTNLLLEKFKIERVVIVSSELHNPKNKSPFAKAKFKRINDLAYPTVDLDSTLKKQAQAFYATSKLCNVLFTYDLNRRLEKRKLPYKILVNAINPGLMLTTNLGRTHKHGENFSRKLFDLIFKLFGMSDKPESSAKAVVNLITEVNDSGKYYDKDKTAKSSVDSYNLHMAEELWLGSEKLIGSTFLNDPT